MITIQQLDYAERQVMDLYIHNDKNIVACIITQLRQLLGVLAYQKYTPSESDLLVELTTSIVKKVESVSMLADGKIIVYCNDGSNYDINMDVFTHQSLWLVFKHITNYFRIFHLYNGSGRYSHQIKRMYKHTQHIQEGINYVQQIFIKITNDIFNRDKSGPYYQWSFNNNPIETTYGGKTHKVTMVERDNGDGQIYIYINGERRIGPPYQSVEPSTLLAIIERMVYSPFVSPTRGPRCYFVLEKTFENLGKIMCKPKMHYVFSSKEKAMKYIEGLKHLEVKAAYWNNYNTKYHIWFAHYHIVYVIVGRKISKSFIWTDEGQRKKWHKQIIQKFDD